MPKTSLTLTNMDTDVIFYHANDERAFFEWIERIECVERVQGEGKLGLVVYLKHRLRKDDLLQLLALCRRYGIDMRQFARFESAKNRHWFADPTMYWHEAVFGSPAARRD